LTLKCAADSNPASSIVWLRNNEEKIIHTGETLDLNTQLFAADYLYTKKYGEYICKAKSLGHEDVQFKTTIVTNGFKIKVCHQLPVRVYILQKKTKN
jgi:hypothetical protein